MTGFRIKNITTVSSLGEQLGQQRLVIGLSVETVSAKIKISVQYLKALEAGAYDQLPGEVYTRNFIKQYAGLLGLAQAAVLTQYQTEQKIFNKTKKISAGRDVGQPVEKVSRFGLIVTPKLIRNIFIGIFALVLVAYLGFKIQGIFAPPFLEISTPAQDIVVTQKVIKVVGRSEIGAVVKINGQQVLADETGNFSESLSLHVGTNIIEVTAQKKNSKSSQVYRKVVVIEEGS